MAAKSEDIYIRVHLDSTNTDGELMDIEHAMERLKKHKEELEKKGVSTSDKHYQEVVKEYQLASKLAAETRASIIKVEEVVSHLASSTTKQLKSVLTQTQRTINNLTRTGEDAEKLALAQEQNNAARKELERRNAAAEPLQRRIKELTKLTADELDRCVKESGKFVQSLPKGTEESQKMLAMYQKFREQQEKTTGQMSLGAATRLASGFQKGSFGQLAEAGKYLKQYKEDWGQFMDATMGRKMDERIQNITKRQLEMARSIANGSVKASYEDMKTALQIIKQRWESLDPNVKKNQTFIHDLGLEYEKLKASVNDWGKMSLDQARRIATGQELASVEKMNEALKVIETTWKKTSLNSHVFNPSELEAERKKLSDMKDELDRLNKKRSEANADYLDQVREIKKNTLESLNGKGGLQRQADEYLDDTYLGNGRGWRRGLFKRQNQLDHMKLNGEEGTLEYAELRKEFEEDYKKYEELKRKISDEKAKALSEMRQVHQQANAANQQIIADIEQQKRLISEQEQRIVNGTTNESVQRIEALKGEQKQLQDTIKHLSDMPKYTQEQLARAQGIGSGQVTPLVGELTEAKHILESYKATLNTTDSHLLDKVREQIKYIDSEIDRINGKTKTLMTEEDAVKAVDRGKSMLARIRKFGYSSVDASEVKALAVAANEAQNAQKASLAVTREAAAVSRELNNLLKSNGTILLDDATKARALSDAQQLLNDKEHANVGLLRETISIYEKMVNMENQDVQTKDRLSKTLAQLNSLYKNSFVDAAKTNLSYDKIVTGDKVNTGTQVSEVHELIDAYKQLKTQKGTTIEQSAEYDKRIKILEASLRSETATAKKAASAANQLAYEEKFVNDTLKNLNTAPAEDLEKAMLMCRNRMRDAQTSLTDYIKASVQLKQMQRQVRGVTDEFKAQSDWLTTNVKKLGNYLGVFSGFYLVRQQFENWFRASMKYDDQLVDIQKTTNMTTQAIHELADGIKRIDTRSSIESLQSLAYSAGKLGVKSVSEVMGFVRAADMLNVSLGEQLGDDAAERLMKVATVMGTTDAYGLEDALMRTGSAITELAKNSAASADPIVAFMARTAGLAKQSGITTAELAGLGAAVSALGQPVEMSATSFSKMMVQMEKSYKTVGAALKMTDKEMETMRLNLETGNGMDAFLDMLKRVKEMGGLSNTASIAKDLGSEGSRVIQTLSTLASSYDTIEKMVRQSTDAFEKNTTVLEEYRKKNNNTAALFERIKNSFAKMFVSPENVEWLNKILRQLQSLPDVVNQIIDDMRPMASFFGGALLRNISGVTSALTDLLYILTGKALVLQLIKLGNAIMVGPVAATRAWIAAGTQAVGTLQRIKLTFAELWASFKAAGVVASLVKITNWVGIAVSAVTVLMDLFKDNKQNVTEWGETSEQAINRVTRTSRELTAEMEKRLLKIKETETEEKKAIGLRQELASMFEGYIGELDVETASYVKLAEAIRKANSEMQAMQLYDATDQRVKEIQGKADEKKGSFEDTMAKTISSRINSGNAYVDDEIAIRVVNKLAEDPSVYNKILRKNGAGEYVDYKFVGGSGGGMREQVEKTINQAILDVLKDTKNDETINPVLFDWSGSDRSTRKSDSDLLNDIYGSLVQVAKIKDKELADVEEAKKYGYTRANVLAKDANRQIVDRMDSSWKKIEQAITRGGTVDVTKDLKQRTSKNSNDATADDWARDVEKLEKTTEGKKQRAAYQEAVGNWLSDARNYLRNLGGLRDRADTEEKRIDYDKQYKALDKQIVAAEKFAEVVALPVKETTDPNADKKAKRSAKDDMDSLLAKIKDFYEIQAEAYRQMRLDEEITETQYQRFLEQNQINQFKSLSAARKAIIGDIKEETWNDIKSAMSGQNVAGATGTDAFGRVDRMSWGAITNIGDRFRGDKVDGSATINNIRRESDKNLTDAKEVAVKIAKEISDAWLAQNPMGKITDQYQKELESLGLMFNDFKRTATMMIMNEETGVMEEWEYQTGESVRDIQERIMKAYLAVGNKAFEFDISTQAGLEAFRKELMQYPDLAKKVATATPMQLQGLYYKLYEYAEQYEQQSQKLAERSINMWKRMYAKDPSHELFLRQQKDLETLMKRYAELEKYGLHERFQLDATVQEKTQKYQDALAQLEVLARRAKAHKAAAEALQVGGVTEDGTTVTAKYKQAEIDSANKELEQLKTEGEAVIAIYGEVLDAQQAVRENTWAWLADMKTAFEKFFDGVEPLRSWYEDKDGPWYSVFGTKEDRQKAFGEFMDDLKKLVREALMEQVKLKMGKWLNLPDKADKYSQESTSSAKDAVNGILGSGRSEAEVDTESLAENKATELEIITQSNLDKEAEALRHKEAMDAIENGEAGTPELSEEEKADLKRKAMGDELSLEEMANQTKLDIRQQMEAQAQRSAQESLNKIFNIKKKGAKEEEKIEKQTAKMRVGTEKETTGEVVDLKADVTKAGTEFAGKLATAEITASNEAAATEESNDVKKSSVGMFGNLGKAITAAWAEGGPYLGPILAAVVTAAVGSVITWVMNMMGHGSSNTKASGAKTKLVSGMLTYDGGNVQSFSPVRTYNNGTGVKKRTINMLPVMGDDGRVYMVPEGDLMGKNDMSEYTGMVTRPTFTSVGNAPALIGERGPEMVIGRETTRAMQMDNPELLRAIIEFDKNRSRGFAKTFDSGNLSEVNSEQLTVNNAPAAPNGITAEQLEANTAVMAALLARLDQPIRAEFNMNGKGGAADQIAQGLLNSKRLGDLDSVKRLLGTR